MNPHDPFFRSLLHDRENAIEFLQYLSRQNAAPDNLLKFVDYDTLKELPTSYSDTATTGYADMAFTAKVKTGGNVRIGILLEHKSVKDTDVINQLRKYFYHVMVDESANPNYCGMPTLATIIYNGKGHWNPFEELLMKYPKEVQRRVLPFEYDVLNVANIPDEDCLKFNPKLSLGLLAMKYIRDYSKFKPLIPQAFARLKKEVPQSMADSLLHEINIYFQKEIKFQDFEEVKNMDFVPLDYVTMNEVATSRGRAEGLSEGKRQMAKAMLANGLAISLVANISGLTEEELKNL